MDVWGMVTGRNLEAAAVRADVAVVFEYDVLRVPRVAPLDAWQADLFDATYEFLTSMGVPVQDEMLDGVCRQYVRELEARDGAAGVFGQSLVGMAGLVVAVVLQRIGTNTARLDGLNTPAQAPRKRQRDDAPQEGDPFFRPSPMPAGEAVTYGLQRLADDEARAARDASSPLPWNTLRKIMDEAARTKITGGYDVSAAAICSKCYTARSANGTCTCSDVDEPVRHFVAL